MIRSVIETEDLLIHVWEAAATPDRPTQDAALVTACNGGVRLAAIDGCSLSRPLPSTGNMDGGAWAAATIRGALVSPDTTPLRLWSARTRACTTQAPGAHAICPRAASSSPTSAPTGSRSYVPGIVRRGSGEERRGSGSSPRRSGRRSPWSGSAPGSRITPTPPPTNDDTEVRLWVTPAAWLTAALGRFPDIKTEAAAMESFEELVLASDGARLDPERLSDLGAWLDDLRAWEREHLRPRAGAKMHDDLTVIRARRH